MATVIKHNEKDEFQGYGLTKDEAVTLLSKAIATLSTNYDANPEDKDFSIFLTITCKDNNF